MVVLHVKRAEESQFLYSCLVTDNVESVLLKVTLPSVTIAHDKLLQIVSIYNGRRKVNRLAEEVKDLAKHGVMIKPELQGEAKVTAIRLFSYFQCFLY